ncbi:MAG: hypothetical protein IPM85_13580 [Chitinophagaceae bacterium]|nr:hypothetical protein [Chitinophagaceae bacterium]
MRVDFIISGHDEIGKPSFIIIELKQWKEAHSTNKDGIIYTAYHGNEAHPFLSSIFLQVVPKDFNESI